MEEKFDASSPEKITAFARQVLADFEADIQSEWDDDIIMTTIKNPETNEVERMRSYPSTESDIKISTYIISQIGKRLKLEERKRGLYLL